MIDGSSYKIIEKSSKNMKNHQNSLKSMNFNRPVDSLISYDLLKIS
jgi:hypothetical protein